MKKLKAFGIRFLALFVGFAASAFGQTQTSQLASSSVPETTQTAPQSGGAQGSPDRPALQHRNPQYKVMRNDVVTISFPLSPELNQKVTVLPDGYIILPN